MTKIPLNSDISQYKALKKALKSGNCNPPPMYNGGQNYSRLDESPEKSIKYTLSIDYFDVTIAVNPSTFSSLLCFSPDAPDNVNIGGFDLEKKTLGTKFYKQVFDVYYHGEKFGSICTVPRASKILDANWCQFKYSNHKLYQSSFIDEFNEFLAALNATVQSYTRVDIALDGYNLVDIYRGYANGGYDRLGRCKMTEHKASIKGVDRVITGVDWGSRKGDKYMTIYRKGHRLQEENKPYIEDFWRNSGLVKKEEDVAKVERMELKMKSKAVKQIIGFDHNKLKDVDYMASCLRTHFRKWFEFIVPGKGNVSRRPRVEVIDWDAMGGVLLGKDTTSPCNEIWSAKLSIKFLDKNYYKGVLGEEAVDVIFKLINDYSLRNWYLKMNPIWGHQRRYDDSEKITTPEELKKIEKHRERVRDERRVMKQMAEEGLVEFDELLDLF